MNKTLHHADADVFIEKVSENKNKISVKLGNNNIFMPVGIWETSYSFDLIEKILDVKGPAFLCDEIMRDESPEHVQKSFYYNIFGHIDRERFKGKRVLDFGCGSGASTMILNRMLPNCQIVGVDLESKLLDIAILRAAHYKIQGCTKFMLSPDGNSLPNDIGEFDFIFLSAVYEHLLPQERRALLPLLYRHLKPDGIFFLNETPYRWFPIELHTTGGLIFINYMPDVIASYYARWFSSRKLMKEEWSTLLRNGVRGGSVREILKILKKNKFHPILMTPNHLGFTDRIDMWHAESSSKSRYLVIKKSFFYFSKLIKVVSGRIFLPTLSLAIKKTAGD
jgi:ubiquinone/menaquinone biosynthesis C-methylase UbiE